MSVTETKRPFITPEVPASWQEPMWYVLFVRSNQEKQVVHRLCQRGIEHLLPSYSSIRKWKDRRVKLELPLFPGYVFVRMPLRERMSALTVPNVVSLIGKKDAPSTVSDEEIAWIRKASLSGRAQPHPQLAAGDQVMITSGVMAGMKGMLLRVQNSTRVVVSIESICRAFVVEVDADWVEPVRKSLTSVSPVQASGSLSQYPVV
jgi:transcription antitermination factor NusG